jgi:hypothetical protein
MDEIVSANSDPRDEIVRLEARIEELAAQVESCRKFILASQLAMVLGAVLLAAPMLGVILFDPLAMSAAIVALLGGVVVLGSNSSTAREARAQIAAAEADRAKLIGAIDFQVVSGSKIRH